MEEEVDHFGGVDHFGNAIIVKDGDYYGILDV